MRTFLHAAAGAAAILLCSVAPSATLTAQPAGTRGGPPGGAPGASRPVAAETVLPDSVLQSSLRVFLDCQGGVRGCDRTFFTQELN